MTQAAPTASAPVTVVSGVPRSGTSLVMQMLGAGGLELLCDDARPPDASNPRGYFELEAVKATARDASWLACAPGRAVKVIHALLPSLPCGFRYRVVWIERDLAEVVASQDRMLRRGGAPEGDRPSADWQAIWAREIEGVRRFLRETPGFEAMTLRHADLIARPRAAAARLAHFVGDGFDVDRAASAVDPALHRERRPGAPPGAPPPLDLG